MCAIIVWDNFSSHETPREMSLYLGQENELSYRKANKEADNTQSDIEQVFPVFHIKAPLCPVCLSCRHRTV